MIWLEWLQVNVEMAQLVCFWFAMVGALVGMWQIYVGNKNGTSLCLKSLMVFVASYAIPFIVERVFVGIYNILGL